MCRYLCLLLLFVFACVDPQPPKVIDLRSPNNRDYVELKGLDSIVSFGDLRTAICEQSRRYDQEITLRLSHNADTFVEPASADDQIILNPGVVPCGPGCHLTKAVQLYFNENKVHFNGKQINNWDELKTYLEGYYELDTTITSMHRFPSKVDYRIDINLNPKDSIKKAIRLLKLTAFAYSDLKREYPNEIPALNILLVLLPPPPPPPPPPSQEPLPVIPTGTKGDSK